MDDDIFDRVQCDLYRKSRRLNLTHKNYHLFYSQYWVSLNVSFSVARAITPICVFLKGWTQLAAVRTWRLRKYVAWHWSCVTVVLVSGPSVWYVTTSTMNRVGFWGVVCARHDELMMAVTTNRTIKFIFTERKLVLDSRKRHKNWLSRSEEV